ncbi:dienelactone hydrolase family protein [Alphaproteobacteria bacterium]|nr:dienelactone hydrolase family protein [Alphaproteobacteria bacterium]
MNQTTSNDRTVGAYFAEADKKDAPVVIFIHEWWGLNDNIKTMAEDIHARGFHAIAIDLFNGSVATNRDEAKTETKAGESNVTVVAWFDWVKATGNGNGKVATLGWCFGGGSSLSAALNTKLDAMVIYYGRVTVNASSLQKLNVPLFIHLALWINPSIQKWLALFKKAFLKLAKAI